VPGARRGVFGVARRIQFDAERLRIHRRSRREFQRPRVDAARELPRQVVEAAAHLAIEIEHVRHEEPDRDAEAEPERDAHDAPDRAQGVERTRCKGQARAIVAETGVSVAAPRASGEIGTSESTCAGRRAFHGQHRARSRPAPDSTPRDARAGDNRGLDDRRLES
jgi:hypothetical protein